jgi:(R,R)-butanediol dehydrogenase/meso-butanediol dehydrogenase/diacetyl reductase
VRALQWHGRGDVRLTEVDEPTAPGPGQVLIDVEWCGICGTDIEEFTAGPIVIPTTPHPLTGVSAPLTMGHEVAGRVAKAGRGVDLLPETLVALDGFLTCGRCRACRVGEDSRCEQWAHIGLSYPGGLAERMLVPARMALPAPSHVAADHLALTEPFAVAVRAARRGAIGLGERVAVIGGGTIGLAVLQVARTTGCAESVLVDPLSSRKRLALEFGATSVGSSIEELVQAGEGSSYDVVFDCTGSPAVPDEALVLGRSGARIVLVGIPPQPGMIDLQSVVLRELSLIGTVGHVYDLDTRAAVSLIASGRVDPAPLITHRLPLERAVDDGFRFLAGDGRASAIKILISPALLG